MPKIETTEVLTEEELKDFKEAIALFPGFRATIEKTLEQFRELGVR